MPQQMFVSLPVRSIPDSMQFFRRLGYDFNKEWSNEKAACMVVGSQNFVMFQATATFQSCAPKPVADGRASECIVCLTVDSRTAVDEMVAKAVAAGARAPQAPRDMGFLYSYGFEDLDGHIWEFMYLDSPSRKHRTEWRARFWPVRFFL